MEEAGLGMEETTLLREDDTQGLEAATGLKPLKKLLSSSTDFEDRNHRQRQKPDADLQPRQRKHGNPSVATTIKSTATACHFLNLVSGLH